MKNLFLLSLLCTTLLTSCSKKGDSSTSDEISENSDCLCSELKLVKTNALGEKHEEWKDVMKDNKLYTGNCIEKDQNDTIIRKLEFKNGWVVRQMLKENIFDNKYLITQDMHYNMLQQHDGYTLGLSILWNGSKFRYVSNYEEFKNGNIFTKWNIGAFDEFLAVSQYFVKGDIMNYWVESDSLGPNTRSRPKCINSAELFQGSDNEVEWRKSPISNDEIYKTLDCLKKEMKPFDYWMLN